MFLRAMAKNALDVEPPLGKIRDFLTDLEPDASRQDRPQEVRLADFCRCRPHLRDGQRRAQHQLDPALAPGLAATEHPGDEVNAILDALNFIQLLRLQHQYLEGEPGKQGDNLIDPETLNELDRRILKESFRQARKIQTRLKLDYQVN
jgi:CBS domain-containing protein